MRSIHPSTPVDAIVSLDGVTCFTRVLKTLADRLGGGWDLETSRGCDGTSILLVTPAAEEVDLTLVVSETAKGFALAEMKGDHLRQVGECATMDQATSILVRHIFQVPARLGLAPAHSVAA